MHTPDSTLKVRQLAQRLVKHFRVSYTAVQRLTPVLCLCLVHVFLPSGVSVSRVIYLLLLLKQSSLSGGSRCLGVQKLPRIFLLTVTVLQKKTWQMAHRTLRHF